MATDPAYHPATTHEFTPGGRRFAVVLPPMVQGGKKPYIFGLPYPSWSGDATRSPKAEPPQSPMIPDVRICAPTPTTSLSEVAFASHPESSFTRSPSRLQGASRHCSPTRPESPPRPVSSSYDPGSARLYPSYHLAESVRHRTPLFDFGVVPPSTPSPSPATRSSPILPTRCSPSAHAVTDVRHVTPFPSTPVIPSAALDPLPLPSTPRHTTPRPFAPTNPAPVPSIPRDTTPLPSSPRRTTPVPSSPRHTTPLPFTPTNPTPLSSTPRRTTPLPFMPMNPAPVPSMPRDTTPVPSSPGHTTPLSSTPRHTTPLPFAPMNPSPVPSVPRGTTPLPHVARPETLTVPSGLRSNLRVSTSPTAQRVSPYPASHPVASSSRVRLEDTAGSRRLSTQPIIFRRHTRKLINVDYYAAWYESQGEESIDYPPHFLNNASIEVNDVFIHAVADVGLQMWIWAGPEGWEPITEGALRLVNERQLVLKANITAQGRPTCTWVTPESHLRSSRRDRRRR